MDKNKKSKPTKELTKGLDKFFKDKALKDDNESSFEKALKKAVNTPKPKKPIQNKIKHLFRLISVHISE